MDSENSEDRKPPDAENFNNSNQEVAQTLPNQNPAAKPEKISVLLKPVGDAPILKQKHWLINADKPVAEVITFVSKVLKLDKDSSLFLFVNQAFAPSPDQLIRNLYECFGADGKLVLHYSRSVAWG